MTQLTEIYKHFAEFSDASACAKETARILATSTMVKWHQQDWIVLVPIGAGLRLNPHADLALLADDENGNGPEEPHSDDLSNSQDPNRRRLRILLRNYCALAQYDGRPLTI